LRGKSRQLSFVSFLHLVLLELNTLGNARAEYRIVHFRLELAKRTGAEHMRRIALAVAVRVLL